MPFVVSDYESGFLGGNFRGTFHKSSNAYCDPHHVSRLPAIPILAAIGCSKAKEMQVFNNMGWKTVRLSSIAMMSLLGFLTGCGGGGGAGETETPPPDPTLQSIEVAPSIPQAAAGTKAQFTATGVFTDNSTQDMTAQVMWATSDGAVATVSNDPGSKGLATAAAAGSTTVTATTSGVSGDTTFTVTDAMLVSIEVSPAAPSLANGLTQQFTATGVFTDNSTQDLTAQVTWASSDGAVATVSNDDGSNGLASGTGVGSTTVSASSGDVTGNTSLTVTDATLVSIELSPVAPSVANGTTQQFGATGLFTDNSTQDLTTQVTWASSDEAVATVSNDPGSNGLATAAAAGSTTVTATSGGVSGDTTLTVTDATLVSIEVSPTAPSLANGLTQQFTATGLFTDNSTQDLTTQVTWTSLDEAVATVSNADGSNGLATATAEGSTTVSATSDGVTGSTTLTVTAPNLLSIEVSPTAPSIVYGTTQQFTATGHYTAGSDQDITTQVTWASSDEAVATVSNTDGSNGLATTAATGSTTVSATSGVVSSSATLTVTWASPTVDALVADLLLAVTGIGPGHALQNKMEDVQDYLAVPNIASACSTIDAFKSQVSTWSGHHITAGQAIEFTADAEEIEAAIPCP